MIDRKKRNTILTLEDQIRPLGEYEGQNDEENSTIRSLILY